MNVVVHNTTYINGIDFPLQKSTYACFYLINVVLMCIYFTAIILNNSISAAIILTATKKIVKHLQKCTLSIIKKLS